MKKRVFGILVGAAFLIVGAMSFTPKMDEASAVSSGLSGTLVIFGGGSIVACIGDPANCIIIRPK